MERKRGRGRMTETKLVKRQDFLKDNINYRNVHGVQMIHIQK